MRFMMIIIPRVYPPDNPRDVARESNDGFLMDAEVRSPGFGITALQRMKEVIICRQE